MRQSYSVICKGNTLFNTPNLELARLVIQDHFSDARSIAIRDNKNHKTVEHYIYGHKQEKKK